MILHNDQGKDRKYDYEQWLFTGLLGLLLLLLLFIFGSDGIRTSETSGPYSESIYCDAEKTQDGQFVTAGKQFSNGRLQSSEQARSGIYSCKIPAGSGLQYGFGYQMKAFQPGEAFRVSVWRWKQPGSDSYLVVEAKGANSFYHAENQPVAVSKNGWEKLQLRFFVPFNQPAGLINIYVYTNGSLAEYFDDLRIERLDQWQEASFRPEVLQLEVPEAAMQQLRSQRTKAMQKGILEVGAGDWVAASIRPDSGETIPVKLRLKGDWLDHLRGDKWSFRVKVKDPHSWKRMITFSLHTPAARYFLHEWLLHRIWEKEGVLTTRYDFVELRLNGESLGIYAYEEHFERQLIESRHRREGPILKLAEDGFWSGIERQLSHHGYPRSGATHSAMDWNNARIEAFGEAELLADSTLYRQYLNAQNLLFQFQRGIATPSQIFDLDKLAGYFAVCDLLNAYHSIVWHNQRFYYNPVIDQLEPIGFDGFAGPPQRQYTILGDGALDPQGKLQDNILAPLFQDEGFIAVYLQHLYRLSGREYLDSLFTENYKDWAPRLQFLNMEFPDYQPKLMDIIQDAQYVHSLILPYQGESILAYTQHFSGDGQKEVLLSNSHTLPLKIVAYGYSNKVPQPLDEPVLLPAQTPRRHQRRLRRDSLIHDFNRLRFLEEVALEKQSPRAYLSLTLSSNARFLFFKLPGIDSLFHAPVLPWPRPENRGAAQELFAGAKVVSNAYMKVSDRRIVFPAGVHRIEQSIVIPRGYQVIFEAGAELDFINGAGFLSRSPVRMYGREEAPIRITSGDGSGGGFSVLEAAKRSELKNVIFDGLNTLRRQGWELTGAVTFYKSEVHLYRCVFRNNHCEDALNTISCDFEMEGCLFTDTYSDGFDSDFCKGRVRNSSFVNTTNDGIDFSGSIVNINDCWFDNNGDKAVSVGEESDVTLFSSSIRAAAIAVASKDLSVLYVKDLRMADCGQGFAAYQKKPEFGGSSIIVESYQAENVRRLHAISEGCSLQLPEGRVISSR